MIKREINWGIVMVIIKIVCYIFLNFKFFVLISKVRIILKKKFVIVVKIV